MSKFGDVQQFTDSKFKVELMLFHHGEKLRTRMRIKRVELKNNCKQNGERIIICIGVSKRIVIYVSREARWIWYS